MVPINNLLGLNDPQFSKVLDPSSTDLSTLNSAPKKLSLHLNFFILNKCKGIQRKGKKISVQIKWF